MLRGLWRLPQTSYRSLALRANSVKLEHNDNIAVLTLNAPKSMNNLTEATGEEFLKAVEVPLTH